MTKQQRQRETLSLALGSGGARGLAHIGTASSEQASEETPTDLGYQERIRQFFDAIGETLGGRDERQLGVFDLTLRSFETMQNAIAAVKLAAYRPDVVIDVPRDACAAHEFHRARELIELGHRLAEEAMAGR